MSTELPKLEQGSSDPLTKEEKEEDQEVAQTTDRLSRMGFRVVANRHDSSPFSYRVPSLPMTSGLTEVGRDGGEPRKSVRVGEFAFVLDSFPRRAPRHDYLEETRHHERTEQPWSGSEKTVQKWRMGQRMKTVNGVLVLCLNIGIDPPDVAKIKPCAKLECWLDPLPLNRQDGVREKIGKRLIEQYERWQARAGYKVLMDPTMDKVQKMMCDMRKNAREERVLFHYNGHGVPRPTSKKEIWVFNESFSKYIPVSMMDVQAWLGAPSVYVFDCSAAGILLDSFEDFRRRRERDHEESVSAAAANNLVAAPEMPPFDVVVLAACDAKEILPMDPYFPADSFTACLTTPMKMALKWAFRNTKLLNGIDACIVDSIPGHVKDRRSPLGELNWVFTAVTDTIAWNTLPPDLFQRLFRQDLLVASLFRNFLLADRILRSAGCTPRSIPELRPTHEHPLWAAWDWAAEQVLSHYCVVSLGPSLEISFFTDQLTAFEVWLDFAWNSKGPTPPQLPVVLQVLLSQDHRLRALELLARFADLGSWAVNQALLVGVHPYILRLLHCQHADLRPVLSFIWAKVLQLDKSCASDLLKEMEDRYFISVVAEQRSSPGDVVTALFVLCCLMSGRTGQRKCRDLLQNSARHINSPNAELRKWLCFSWGRLWRNYGEVKDDAIVGGFPETLVQVATHDPDCEVRACAIHSLGQFFGDRTRVEAVQRQELNFACQMQAVLDDQSPLVRKELVKALGKLVRCYEEEFAVAANKMTSQAVSAYDQMTQSARSVHIVFPHLQGGGQQAQVAQQGGGGIQHRSSGTPVVPAIAGHQQQKRTSMRRVQSASDLSHMKKFRALQASGSVGHPQVSGAQGVQARVSVPVAPPVPGGGGVVVAGGRAADPADHGASLIRSDPLPTLDEDASKEGAECAPSGVVDHIWSVIVALACDPHRDVSKPAEVLMMALKMFAAPMSIAQILRLIPVPVKQGNIVLPQLPNGLLNSAAASGAGPDPPTGPTQKKSKSVENLLRVKSRENLVRTQQQQQSKRDHNWGHRGQRVAAREDSDTTGSDVSSSDFSSADDRWPSILESDMSEFVMGGFDRHIDTKKEDTDPEMEVLFSEEARNLQRSSRMLQAGHALENQDVPIKHLTCSCDNETRYHSAIRFHSFLPQLIVADDKGRYGVWDVEGNTGVLLNSFWNTSPDFTRVNSIRVLNELRRPLLLGATSDGVVRIWAGYDRAGEETLVSAWRASKPPFVYAKQGGGHVVAWNQDSGFLFTGGCGSSVIRVWDLEREFCVQNMECGGPKRAPVTALSAGDDELGHRCFVAGCGDGRILLFDSRAPDKFSLTASWNEHRTYIVGVFAQRNSKRKVITGDSSGKVKIWDRRMNMVFHTMVTDQISAMAVHPYAPLIACGCQQKQVLIASIMEAPKPKNVVKHFGGFLLYPIGYVRCLDFHNCRLWLGMGSGEKHVSIFSSE